LIAVRAKSIILKFKTIKNATMDDKCRKEAADYLEANRNKLVGKSKAQNGVLDKVRDFLLGTKDREPPPTFGKTKEGESWVRPNERKK